jgi:hypothetical protein
VMTVKCAAQAKRARSLLFQTREEAHVLFIFLASLPHVGTTRNVRYASGALCSTSECVSIQCLQLCIPCCTLTLGSALGNRHTALRWTELLVKDSVVQLCGPWRASRPCSLCAEHNSAIAEPRMCRTRAGHTAKRKRTRSV